MANRASRLEAKLELIYFNMSHYQIAVEWQNYFPAAHRRRTFAAHRMLSAMLD